MDSEHPAHAAAIDHAALSALCTHAEPLTDPEAPCQDCRETAEEIVRQYMHALDSAENGRRP